MSKGNEQEGELEASRKKGHVTSVSGTRLATGSCQQTPRCVPPFASARRYASQGGLAQVGDRERVLEDRTAPLSHCFIFSHPLSPSQYSSSFLSFSVPGCHHAGLASQNVPYFKNEPEM